MLNISSDPLKNDLDIMSFNPALYDKVQLLGVSEQDKQALLKNIGKKPKPVIPKFRLPQTDKSRLMKCMTLSELVECEYNSAQSNGVGVLEVNGQYIREASPEMKRLVHSLMSVDGRSEEEARAIQKVREATIQYILNGKFEIIDTTSESSNKLLKALEKFVKSVITYERSSRKSGKAKGLNP